MKKLTFQRLGETEVYSCLVLGNDSLDVIVELLLAAGYGVEVTET